MPKLKRLLYPIDTLILLETGGNRRFRSAVKITFYKPKDCDGPAGKKTGKNEGKTAKLDPEPIRKQPGAAFQRPAAGRANEKRRFRSREKRNSKSRSLLDSGCPFELLFMDNVFCQQFSQLPGAQSGSLGSAIDAPAMHRQQFLQIVAFDFLDSPASSLCQSPRGIRHDTGPLRFC